MAKTIYWRVVPGVTVLIVHTNNPPSDEDWDDVLQELKDQGTAVKGALVFSRDSGPSAGQRARYVEVLKLNPEHQCAVMTTSRVVRGAITAFGWMMVGNQIKGFNIADYDGATTWLNFTDDEKLEALVQLKQLANEVGISITEFG